MPDTLRDPQTGIVYDVVWRKSGRALESPVDPKAAWRGSTAERCALYGGTARDDARDGSREKDEVA
jgi:hypothetical protein